MLSTLVFFWEQLNPELVYWDGSLRELFAVSGLPHLKLTGARGYILIIPTPPEVWALDYVHKSWI